MSNLFQIQNFENRKRKLNELKGFRLTDREKEILKFILEMKFASIDELYFHFFQINRDGTESVSQLYTKERISILKKAGFLDAKRITTENKYYYVGTKLAYDYLKNVTTLDEICEPLNALQAQNFIHDLYVLHSRIILSRSLKIQKWTSEKALIDSDEFKNVFTREFRPDGLYRDSNNQGVAFELENTLKSKERTIKKIRRYVELLRNESDVRNFDKVHYVCTKPAIFKSIKEHTEAYESFFRIDCFLDLSSPYVGAK